jgi:hypothetical protein
MNRFSFHPFRFRPHAHRPHVAARPPSAVEKIHAAVVSLLAAAGIVGVIKLLNLSLL